MRRRQDAARNVTTAYSTRRIGASMANTIVRMFYPLMPACMVDESLKVKIALRAVIYAPSIGMENAIACMKKAAIKASGSDRPLLVKRRCSREDLQFQTPKRLRLDPLSAR